MVGSSMQAENSKPAEGRHPKRVPPENSVCIRKTPSRTASSNLSILSNKAANGEEPSFYKRSAQPNRELEAESAKTWFDDSNKNVSGESGTKFYNGLSYTYETSREALM
jgi:hypothetical protein